MLKLPRIYDIQSGDYICYLSELKEALGVSTATVYRIIKRCKLPTYKLFNKKGTTVIPLYELWRIIPTHYFKKYLSRADSFKCKTSLHDLLIHPTKQYLSYYQFYPERYLKYLLLTPKALVDNCLLPITVEEANTAANVGIIPTICIHGTHYVIPEFKNYLEVQRRRNND